MMYWVDWFRIFHGEKVSGARLMVYTVFGYVIAGAVYSWIHILNLFVVFGGVLTASALNDYFDSVHRGEHTAIGEYARHYPWIMLLIAWIPWICSLMLYITFFSVWHGRLISHVALWLSFLLSIGYSVPPIRFKQRRIFGLIVPPLGIFLLFIEGLFLGGTPNTFALHVAVLVFFFALYLELIHLYDDTFEVHEVERMPPERVTFLIQTFPFIGMGVSVILSLSNPLFLCSLVAWILRFRAIRMLTSSNIKYARRHITHQIWQLWDFGLYGIICFL